MGRGLDCESAPVIFVGMDHDIFSTVIHTVPLLWHVQKKLQFLSEVKATSTGKLRENLPRNDAVVELCSG
jgi:hypothetical protein